MRPLLFCLLMTVGAAAQAQQAADAVAPEAATTGSFAALSQPVADALTAKAKGRPVEASNWMVAAANPWAADAGAAILAQGGTAADALVAVQAVLGLVEPQSSGLGGGAFLVYYDAATQTLTTLDGRETAPLAATPRLFQNENGEPGLFRCSRGRPVCGYTRYTCIDASRAQPLGHAAVAGSAGPRDHIGPRRFSGLGASGRSGGTRC